jgi:excisionase family DNA binding protein
MSLNDMGIFVPMFQPFRNMQNPIKNQQEAVTDELITKKETARRLKLCTRKVELMVNAGEIPVIRIGSSVRFNWPAVLNALETTIA